MLVSKYPNNGDIVAIRLSNGEEVVGKMTSETGETLSLAKPIIVQLQMVQPGQAAISFAPFMLSVDDAAEFTFYKSAFHVAPSLARQDIKANYIKATTGLDIPANGASAILKP